MSVQKAEEVTVVSEPESPWALMSRLDDQQVDAMLEPAKAAAMVAGMRPDTLCYSIKQFGSGPDGKPKEDIIGVSVTGANVLAAQRGLEVLEDYRIDEIEEVPIDVWVIDAAGKKKKEDFMVPGVRAAVRVRDPHTGNVTLGIAEQPRFIVLKDGGKKADGFAVIKAVSKAARNAKLDHFAGLESLMKDFYRKAKASGQAYIAAEVPDEQQAAVNAVRTAVRHVADRAAGPLVAAMIGEEASREVWDTLRALCAGRPALMKELPAAVKGYMVKRWGKQKVAELLTSELPSVYAYVGEMVKQAADADGEPPAPPEVEPTAVSEEVPVEIRTEEPDVAAALPLDFDEAAARGRFRDLWMSAHSGEDPRGWRKAWDALEGPDTILAEIAALEADTAG